MRLKLFLFILLSASASLLAATYRPVDVPNVHVANRGEYVSNPDGVLTAQEVAKLNSQLQQLWNQTTAEVVVVAIDSLAEGYDETHFANELFELWGIGKADKDNGLLLLVVNGTHRWTVRTGRGMSAVLPDVVCSQVMRQKAVPYFKQGLMAQGIEAALSEMSEAITDPDSAADIRSKYENDANASNSSDDDAFRFMVRAGMIAGVVCLLLVIVVMIRSRKKTELERYRSLNNIKPVLLFLSFAGMGFPVVALLICLWKMNQLRNHKRLCQNCSHIMKKLDEQTDNNYLTPAQDLEEQLNSIDYDVWLCTNCGEKEVIPYINRQSAYAVCPYCSARTLAPAGNRIIKQPTHRSEGLGERIFACRNCGKTVVKPYTIERTAAPVVIIPGGGGFGGGGFGGGGFSGGSFGGGGTSGGGASGGW